MPATETVPMYDAFTQEWRPVAVETVSEPARRTRGRKPGTPARHGAPRDLTGLSDSSPLPAWWRDTAFAPGEPLADMRRNIAEPFIKTHRAPTVMPAGNPGDPNSLARWVDL